MDQNNWARHHCTSQGSNSITRSARVGLAITAKDPPKCDPVLVEHPLSRPVSQITDQLFVDPGAVAHLLS
jgi:hypothetical protein